MLQESGRSGTSILPTILRHRASFTFTVVIGSKEVFAFLAEGPLARGWSAALPGYTLAPDASLTQITNEVRTAFDWLNAKGAEHGIEGPIIVTGWSAGGHLTAFILDHPKVTRRQQAACHCVWHW